VATLGLNKEENNMIFDCPHCLSKVDAKVLAEYEVPPTEDTDPYKYYFLVCQICNTVMVGLSDYLQFGWEEYSWSDPERLWPKPKRNYDFKVPILVHQSIEEAEKCFYARAYSACAVMCGRALEAICSEKTSKKSLYEGLQELKKKKIIDDLIFDWGETLRKERNIGAHASTENITQKDAGDILDFTNAIVDYIYILSEKYKDFQDRKKK